MSIDDKVKQIAHCYDDKEFKHRQKDNSIFDWLHSIRYKCTNEDDKKMYKTNELGVCPYYDKGDCWAKLLEKYK